MRDDRQTLEIDRGEDVPGMRDDRQTLEMRRFQV